MQTAGILGLLGGLALFLYGMQMMSAGLEAAAGNRMKRILERLATNRFLGVAVGAGITAVIQSSSATTVMVVGFVNSGMMTLQQAVWIIMGANIGTTITGQLIALDVGALAPLFAFCGVAMVVFFKKPAFHHYGQIIAGLGILFLGMDMMSAAMMPLRDSATFVNLITKFSNPVVGICAGMVFTALIQSSSASVGILQALAVSGVIGLPSAVYVLFGQNIGTCITAVLAAIGTSRNAKRTTVIHLLFNVTGTIVFTLICIVTPLTALVQNITPGNPAAQIANMHTLFNVATTLLLIPFGTYLASVAKKILPDSEAELEKAQCLRYIKPMENPQSYSIGTSAIIVNGVWRELGRMVEMAKDNVERSFLAVENGDAGYREVVEETEEYLDYLNKEITKYISHVMTFESNERDTLLISAFFKITGNLERIGDHAMNICGYATMMNEKEIHFSQPAQAEIVEMRTICMSALELLRNLETMNVESLSRIAGFEQKIDDMTERYRQNQIARMRQSSCSDEACILYSEILTDFERIGDHILNVGQEIALADTFAGVGEGSAYS